MKISKNILESEKRQMIKSELVKEKIIDTINQNGLFSTLALLRINYIKLFAMIGNEWITNKIMIKFIRDTLNYFNDGMGIGFVEIGRDFIFFNENEDEIREITYVDTNKVFVDVYDKLTDSYLGEFTVSLHGLSDEQLMEVFDAITYYHGEMSL